MDIERAKEIIEAFGFCSIVYECMTPEEVAKEIEDGKGERGWCATMLSVEDISADRRCHDGPEPYREWKKMEKEIRKRLAAIGIARLRS
jgi:hypothetical protein